MPTVSASATGTSGARQTGGATTGSCAGGGATGAVAVADIVASPWGPVEMLAQEVEGAAAVDDVAAVEELDRRALRQAQARIEPAHLRIFEGDVFVEPDAVGVAALHHEGPRCNQGGHLRVVEGVAEVELVHVVF